MLRTELPSRPTSCAWTGRDRFISQFSSRAATATRLRSSMGSRSRLASLLDVPKSLVTEVVFDQSIYVKTAIWNVWREGGIGLVLTAVMVLIFLGSVRATFAVMLSIPLSCLAAFLALNASGGTINTMVLGGIALVLSRLIDNSVVVLENIFRHLEIGRASGDCGGKRWTRSCHGGTGGYLDDCNRFLSRGLSLRGQPFSVYGAGRGGRASPCCLVRRGHDSGSVILRTVYSSPHTSEAAHHACGGLL